MAPYVPQPTYGKDLLAKFAAEFSDIAQNPLVCTQPEPWQLAKKQLPLESHVHFVDDVDHGALKQRCEEFRKHNHTVVIGIGGGSALDTAKFASQQLNLALVLCPSILSVDAGYTVAAGVRETTINGSGKEKTSVVYVGDSRPTALLIDYNLLQAAPRVLNWSGIGDLLSCATALWDWEEAQKINKEEYDDNIASRTRTLLEQLLAPKSAIEIRDVTEDGLHLLSELYVEEVTLCEMWGNARCEEGSEHYVAYALEDLTGRHYLHGQLIALCVIIVGTYQGQDMQPVVDYVRSIGLDCSFKAVGATREEFYKVLTTMGDFVKSEPQLLPGVFHFRGSVDSDAANALLDMVESAFMPMQSPECEECLPVPCDSDQWWACTRCRRRKLGSRKFGFGL